MIVLSGTGRSPLFKRIKFLIDGALLMAAASFTIFASTVYNQAIATTNTELISNAVIILFITDIDEMVHGIAMTIYPRQIKKEEAKYSELKEEEEHAEEKENAKKRGRV